MTTTITDKLVKAVIAATNATFAGLVKEEEVTNITISIPYITITCTDGGSRCILLSTLEKYYNEHQPQVLAASGIIDKKKAKKFSMIGDDQLFG